MSRITYFAVLPFSRDANGDFLAEAAIDVRSAVEARATAASMAVADRGAVAFSKSGDPQLGEWDDAVILRRQPDRRSRERRCRNRARVTQDGEVRHRGIGGDSRSLSVSWSARHHAWLIRRRIGVFPPPARRDDLQRSIRQQLAIPSGASCRFPKRGPRTRRWLASGLIRGIVLAVDC
jgi:hypothetical protein